MARRIPGQFVPLDVNLPSDPKLRRAGPDAELLFIRGLLYIKRTGSDGFIPEYDLPAAAVGCRNVKAATEALVAVGRWEATSQDGNPGWLCGTWLKWNMSQEEIEAAKQEKRLGALKTNHGKGQHTEGPVPGCPDCAEVQAA